MGLDYGLRFSEFHVDRDGDRETSLFLRLCRDGDYIFVHDDPERGLSLDYSRVRSDLAIVRPEPSITGNIFDYCLILQRATELHCIDSSFRHLADSLDCAGRKFFHRYVRPVDVPSLREWEILN